VKTSAALALALGIAIGSLGSAALAAPPPAKPAPAPAARPPAPPATPAKPAAAPRQVTSVEGITEYVLGNGLHVLLFPDPSKDTFTVNITYLVGSRMEGYGETGMAHLLEHMLFKGSPKHPKVWEELEQRGAANNASTWYDRTNYFETLPAKGDNLAWALELEADRMVNANIAQSDLDKEFSVVRNEFEISENDPSEILSERMWSTAYLWHNYGKSTIGSRADIEKVPATSLKRFYKKYYRPDNAVLVVAGKFDAPAALNLISTHFSPVANPPAPIEPTYTTEPVQDGERVVSLRRNGDIQVVGLVYHVSAAADADFAAVAALGDVLTVEPSGRLYTALVKSGLATSVDLQLLPLHDPGLIQLTATLPASKSIDAVRDKMIAVVLATARGSASGCPRRSPPATGAWCSCAAIGSPSSPPRICRRPPRPTCCRPTARSACSIRPRRRSARRSARRPTSPRSSTATRAHRPRPRAKSSRRRSTTSRSARRAPRSPTV
jgi:zinc protease